MGILCLLVLIPHRRGGWGLHSRLVHVSHLESTVTGMFAILLICFLCFILAHRMLAMTQSFVVLGCNAWNSLPHDVNHAEFVAALTP
jgi:hypothetical protein